MSKVDPVASKVEVDTQFRADLEPDEFKIIEVLDFIETRYRAKFGVKVNNQIAAAASLHYLGHHYSDKWFRQGNLAEMVLSAVTGRNDGENDN